MIFLLAGLSMLTPLAIDMFLPGIPAISHDLNARSEAAVAIVSVFFAGLSIGQLFFGPWSDRAGRRLPMIAGLLTYIVGALMAAMAQSIELLLFGRLLQSLGASAVTVASRAAVRDLFDEREAARLFSTMSLISGLAPVLAPVLGAGLLSIGSWRMIFAVLACLAACALVALLLKFPESLPAETARRSRATHPLRNYLGLLSQKRMIGFLLAGGLNSACFFAYLGSAALIFMNVYGMSPGLFSFAVAANSVGLVFSAQINRMLLKHWTPRQILAGSSFTTLLFAAGFIIFGLNSIRRAVGHLAIAFLRRVDQQPHHVELHGGRLVGRSGSCRFGGCVVRRLRLRQRHGTVICRGATVRRDGAWSGRRHRLRLDRRVAFHSFSGAEIDGRHSWPEL